MGQGHCCQFLQPRWQAPTRRRMEPLRASFALLCQPRHLNGQFPQRPSFLIVIFQLLSGWFTVPDVEQLRGGSPGEQAWCLTASPRLLFFFF